MVGLLTQCDILVNPITRGAAQSIINKHADYMAAKKAIISTQERGEFSYLIDKYDCGINASLIDEIREAIRSLLENPERMILKGKNARKCAFERFDRGKTYLKLVKLIEDTNDNV